MIPEHFDDLIHREAEKDTRLKLKIYELLENGKSAGYIKSYVIGWTKKASSERKKRGKKNGK